MQPCETSYGDSDRDPQRHAKPPYAHVEFQLGSEAFNFLATGETLILTYTVSATDDDGSPLSDTETVTVTITGTGDAPPSPVDRTLRH